MNVKLIAIDLDGTLIDKRLVISGRVERAIAAAREKDVHVSIVTGRMFAAARPFVDTLGLRGPIVCYQGAATFSAATGERLQHIPVANDVALEVVRRSKADGVHVQCYFDEQIYVESINEYSKRYSALSRVEPIVVPSLVDELKRGRESTKIVCVLDPERAEAYMTATRDLFGSRAYVTRSNPDFVEVVDPHVDKGRSLAYIAERDGIAMDATMGIGDSWNDVPLLRAAAFGVAMGSAPPELREAADAVVADVAHDGVAEAIERFVLA